MKKILVFIALIACLGKAEAEQKQEPPKPGSAFSIYIGYTGMSLGSFKLAPDNSDYPFDRINNTYQYDAKSNYNIGAAYSIFIGKQKNVEFRLGLSYESRAAGYNSQPRYIVRHPVTLDTVEMMTDSHIDTKFSAMLLDLKFLYNLPVTKFLSIHAGFGFYGGIPLDNSSADYSETILGHLTNDKIIPLDLNFNNGTKNISFNNTENQDFANSIKGNTRIYGAEFILGINFNFTRKIGIGLDLIERSEFTSYLNNQDVSVSSTEGRLTLFIKLK
ncbi:MAG: hypothetical protein QG635_185 [Bacteroidota bacterium]|nr:hypothetical protein [Bacteroidota bacterium]